MLLILKLFQFEDLHIVKVRELVGRLIIVVLLVL